MADQPTVAIIDYGMGNLYSVRHACLVNDLNAVITSSREEIEAADGIILPGVGAFGDAMQMLKAKALDRAIFQFAETSKPILGICLGMQMLMEESYEFGKHLGLGLIPGSVVRFDRPQSPKGECKVPQVGWNQIYRATNGAEDPWLDTPFETLSDGVYMYFVHSFYVKPKDTSVQIGHTRYGHIDFCSVLRRGNLFACQAHPEKSGKDGMKVYANLASMILKRKKETCS
jgi:imidazole glycerol-phosphate synthase subunit HisH